MRDSSIGVALDGTTEATWRKGRACAGDILVGAFPFGSLADALGGLRGACHVWVRSVVRDSRAGALGNAVEPLVWPINRTTMAGTDIATVENVLHRQVDVDSLGLASDLDTISEGADGSMGPA